MMLVKSGYVPIVIKKEQRLQYYEALDKAHVEGDCSEFIKIYPNTFFVVW